MAIDNTNKTLFILSVDTEEEWDWDKAFPQQDCNVSNVSQLPKFQAFCNKLGIKPSYFVDYAVADNPQSAAILKKIVGENNCEIGGHLHPWCNPPITGETREKESHVVNLPLEMVEAKLDHLNQKIYAATQIEPRSFRTGRWGINSQVLKLVAKKGYKVDSSVYPFYSNDSFSCEGAHLKPYWPSYDNPLKPGGQGDICEIPITAGYNRTQYSFWNSIHRLLSKKPFTYFRLIGFLWRFGFLRKIYLSPELSHADDMKKLVRSALKRKHPVIHMYLHSSTLLPGANQFVKNQTEEENFYKAIEETVTYLKQASSVEFCTISEAAEKLKQQKLL